MCKAPSPGRAKTRLTPDLSADQAARVAEIFLRHAADSTARRLGRLGVGVRLCYAPADGRGAVESVVGVAAAGAFPQSGGDLGARMAAAVGHLRRDATGVAVLVLGTDSPDVPASALSGAVDRLAGGAGADPADVVLGPTDDGGYWCLGVGPRVDPAALLGDGIEWSSGREFDQTRRRAERLGHAVALAPAWPDVDRPADLADLLARLSRSADPDDRRLLDALNWLPTATPAEAPQ